MLSTYRLPIFPLSTVVFTTFFGRLKQNDRGNPVVLTTDAGPRGLRWISSLFAPCFAVPTIQSGAILRITQKIKNIIGFRDPSENREQVLSTLY